MGSTKTARRILVIEDEVMVAEAVSEIIVILGHQVATYESGLDALAAIGGEEFDLAIVDLELPVMPGIEVAKRLHEICPPMRILFSTGYSEQEEQIDLSQPHVAGIIHKPFELAELRQAIDNALA